MPEYPANPLNSNNRPRIARRRGTGTRRTVRRGLAGALGVLALVATVAARTARPAPAAGTVKVTVTVSETGKLSGAISDRYIGLSFESGTLNNGYRYDNVGNLARLLKNLGHSIMRFGGDTADRTYASTSPRVLDGLGRLTKASGWSVLWTENLLHFSASGAASDGRALNSALGTRLFAIACGNEPDMYAHDHLRPPDYSAGDYVREANACYLATRTDAPNVPVEGPDTAWNTKWLAAYAGEESGMVRAVGQHYYPLGCAPPGASPAKYLPVLLSPSLARKEAKTVAGYVKDARQAKAPLMLTETNSACGGGVRGLSNAYASALWVIDFLLIGAQHGVAGMQFHGGLNTLCGGYTVLCQVGKTTYRPQPVYYGMAFTHLFRAGRFLPVSVATSPRAYFMPAFAGKPSHGGNERIMVDNLGGQHAAVTLRVGGYRGTAAVLFLRGPSPLATSGVTIQGAAVAGDGTLTPGRPSKVSCTDDGCRLTIPPYSAALVTLR